MSLSSGVRLDDVLEDVAGDDDVVRRVQDLGGQRLVEVGLDEVRRRRSATPSCL